MVDLYSQGWAAKLKSTYEFGVCGTAGAPVEFVVGWCLPCRLKRVL